MKRILVLAMAGVMTTLLSCTKNELQLEPEFPTGSGNTTPVEFALTTAQPDIPRQVVGSKSATDQAFGVDFSAPLETKAADELSLTQEQAVLNLWVLQYDGSGNLVGEPCFVTLSDIRQNDDAVSFNAKLTASSTAQTVYFIANTNDPGLFTAANAATVTALNAMSITLSEEFRPSPGEGLPMIAVQQFAEIHSEVPLTGITLRRLVAKVTVRYKVFAQFDFEVTDVSIGNVPKQIYFTPQPDVTTVFPSLTDEQFEVYASEDASAAGTDGEYRTFTWYVPESHRFGTGITSNYDHTVANSTGGSAMYVQVLGVSEGNPIKFNVVLRTQNDFTDMTVRRNYTYTVTMDLKTFNDSDNRVEAEILNTANCFMVPLGETVAFNAKVRGNETAATLATASVGVIWQDVNGLITDVDYNSSNGKATFSTLTGTAGNALVAAYNASNEILWSWHIWVSDYEPVGQTTVAENTPYTVTGGQVHTYGTNFVAVNPGKVMMDRNLGATAAYYAAPSTTTEGAKAFGFFYQWGRKDPFPNWDGVSGTNGTGGSFVPLYDASGSTVTPTFVAGSTTVAASILNPTLFYYNATTPYDWLSTQDDTRWGGGTTKGLYDPCPTGWRIAPTGTWNDFTTTNANVSSVEGYTGTLFQYWINGVAQTANGTPTFAYSGRNGRLYTAGTVTAWYPTPGYLRYNTGILNSGGFGGYSWASTANGIYAHSANFGRDYIHPIGNASNCSSGFQTRCIQE